MGTTLQIFAFLQIIDLLTTLIGFRLGASEASPFIRMFLSFGPVPALVIAKAVAFGLGGACLALRRLHVVTLINYWYAALAAWNLIIILKLLEHAVVR